MLRSISSKLITNSLYCCFSLRSLLFEAINRRQPSTWFSVVLATSQTTRKIVPILSRHAFKRHTSKFDSFISRRKRYMILFSAFRGALYKRHRDSEKYIFPDITKVSVTVNGSPNMLYNDGIENEDTWAEASRFFVKEKAKPNT